MAVARRVCTVTFVALASSLPALPGAAAVVSERADGRALFQVQTTAAAVHVTLTQQPASSIIVASLFDDAVAYAASDFDSSGASEALAASAFPGRLVVQGPELLCSQLFSCPTSPPAYPLLADASYPRRTHDTAPASGQPVGSGPFVVTPLRAEAQARAASNSSSTEAGRVTLFDGTPASVVIGSSSADSAVHATNRRLVVTVRTTVSDVTIGGRVHITSVHSIDRIVMVDGHRPASRPTIRIGTVTVDGHNATIDERGLHVDGADGPALTQFVKQQGVSIRAVGAHRTHTRRGVRSDATAMTIDVNIPVSGVPYVPNPLPPFPPPFDPIPQLPGVNANGTYVAHLTLGAVGAAAGLGVQPSFDLGGVGSVPTAPTTTSTTTPGSAGTVEGNDLLTDLATGSGSAPPAVAPSRPPALRAFADLLSKSALEKLYAVLALGTLALFVGWRGTVFLHRRRG